MYVAPMSAAPYYRSTRTHHHGILKAAMGSGEVQAGSHRLHIGFMRRVHVEARQGSEAPCGRTSGAKEPLPPAKISPVHIEGGEVYDRLQSMP